MKDQSQREEEPQPQGERDGLCAHERFGRTCMLRRGHQGKHEWRDVGRSIQWS